MHRRIREASNASSFSFGDEKGAYQTMKDDMSGAATAAAVNDPTTHRRNRAAAAGQISLTDGSYQSETYRSTSQAAYANPRAPAQQQEQVERSSRAAKPVSPNPHSGRGGVRPSAAEGMRFGVDESNFVTSNQAEFTNPNSRSAVQGAASVGRGHQGSTGSSSKYNLLTGEENVSNGWQAKNDQPQARSGRGSRQGQQDTQRFNIITGEPENARR
jgi:hypothetical protein